MGFDAQDFLDRYAGAYNDRDPEGMRAFFDLSDTRFAVFEDFTGDLIDGDGYSAMLESAFDATGRMSFELLRCDDFRGIVVLHAIQRIVFDDEEGVGEARIRATLWIKIGENASRVVSAHFSAVPSDGEGECGMGECGCSGHQAED